MSCTSGCSDSSTPGAFQYNFTGTSTQVNCNENDCINPTDAGCVTYTGSVLTHLGLPTELQTNVTEEVLWQYLDQLLSTIECCQNDTLNVFYVDGNNIPEDASDDDPGDGSVGNPFRYLDSAYDKVIGNGTITLPQYENVSVMVAAFSYSTAINCYASNTTWYCADGAIIDFTGTGYFIDSSSVTSTSKASTFKFLGGASFRTGTGGFLKNEGATLSVLGKHIVIQAFEIVGYTPSTSGTLPLIAQTRITSSSGFNPPLCYVSLQPGGRIESYQQTTIELTDGAWFYMDLNGSQLGYGRNGLTGTTTTSLTGNVLHYTHSATYRPYIAQTRIRNGYAFSINNDNMIDMSGSFNIFELTNITATTPNPSAPKPLTFISIGTVTAQQASGSTGDYSFLLKDVNLNRHYFNTTGSAPYNVISYTGSGTLSTLQMQNCCLYKPLCVSSNISLGASVNSGATVAALNVINGQIAWSQLPVYANNTAATTGGLTAGMMYMTSAGDPKITT